MGHWTLILILDEEETLEDVSDLMQPRVESDDNPAAPIDYWTIRLSQLGD